MSGIREGNNCDTIEEKPENMLKLDRGLSSGSYGEFDEAIWSIMR